MADSLIDFGQIAQLSQNNIQNAISLGWLQQRQDRTDIQQQRANMAQQQMELDQQRLKQSATFKAFDEIDKLAASPQFATPMQQVDLRYTQANLLKTGLGLNIPMPSREEMVGAYEQFADNIKQFRQSADPGARRAALENLVLAAPQYGKNVLDDLKKAGELDVQGEDLMTKLELNKSKLQALNVQSGRAAIQQGLFSENLGALSQAMQVTKTPQFQAQFQKLQGMTPLAQQAYLKMNPQFQQAFSQAIQPHLDKIGAVGPEYEQAFGEDVKPKYLAAMDQQMQQMLQAKNAAVEQTGAIPTELHDQIAGLELVRKARGIQYEWMRDPFNKDKFKALQKAQQDIKLAFDATGKTLTGIQGERDSIAQTKLDAEQQEKLASDYAQEQYKGFLDKGYNENKAAVLAGKQTQQKYPDTPYNADKLKVQKPLTEVVNKIDMKSGEALAKGVEDVVKSTRDQALGAIDTVDAVDRIRTAIQSGNVNLGPTATLRNNIQQFASAMGIGGNTASERIINTRNTMKGLAEFTLAARKQLKGQGQVSDFESKLINKASSGEIDDFTQKELQSFIGVTDRLARKQYALHERNMETMRKNPNLRDVASFYEVPPLPPSSADAQPAQGQRQSQTQSAQPQAMPTIKSEADYNKLTPGTIYIGPDGKQRRKK